MSRSFSVVYEPHGELTVRVGSADPRPVGARGIVCLMDGYLRDLDALSAKVGGPPGSTAEELVALGYGRWGDGVVERLRGDFSLLVWDAGSRRGVIARDQLGHRSIYVHAAGGRLHAAGEIRDLLAIVPRRPPPDDDALVRWLVDLEPQPGRTLYAGVRELPPGHLISLSPDGPQQRPYWSPRFVEPGAVERDAAAATVREALRRAVRGCSPATGPVGLTLSGGLDSTTVAGIAASELPLELRAYSATFPGRPSMDESGLIEESVQQLSLRSTRIQVERGSVLAGNLEYLDTWGVPASSPNVFFWLPLGRQAADDGVSVLLDGEGGDEVFGLSPYLIADRLLGGRPLAAARLARAVPGEHSLRSDARLLMRYGAKGAVPGALHSAARSVRSRGRFAPAWLAPDAARSYARDDASFRWKRRGTPRWWGWLADSMTGSSAYGHIRRRAAIAGLEPRHPLHDLDLVEAVLALPPELAYDPRFYRPLLREATRGLIPERVRVRAGKSYFDPLFCECLVRHDLPTIRRLLLDPKAETRRLVAPESVRRLLESHPTGHPQGWRAWARDVMALAAVEAFLRAQAEPAFPARLLAGGELLAPSYKLISPRGLRNQPSTILFSS